MPIFYGGPAEIRQLETKDTLTKHLKIRFDSKLSVFKKIPFLILTNQNKPLYIILTNQNKALCIKIKQSPGNSRKSMF